jgi:hypothetical protein
MRLQAIGADLRRLGVNGLIYPSARVDVAVEYGNGSVLGSKGWNLVLYRGSSPPREAVHLDLGGWGTQFWSGVRLEERATGPDTRGWYVVGLELLQHLQYEHAMRAKGIEF